MAALLLTGLTFTSPLMAETPEEEYLTDENSETAELIDKVQEVEKLIYEVQSQFQCLTNSLSSILSPLPDDVNEIASLLFSEGSTSVPVTLSDNAITIRNDAKIYYGDMELLDVIKSWANKPSFETSATQAELSSMSGASLMAVQTYATKAEFDNLSSLVSSLSNYAGNIKAELAALQTKFSAFQNSANSADKALNENLEELAGQVKKLQNTILEYRNGCFNSTASPIEKALPPECVPVLYSASSIGGYYAATFKANRACRLKSVTLYCDNSSYRIPAGSLFILSADLGWAPAYAKSVSYSGNYATYSFAQPTGKPETKNVLNLLAGRSYYLAVKSSRLYVCDRYRGDGLIDAFLMKGSDSSGAKYYLSRESTDAKKEIWAKFDAGETGLAFDYGGLSINDGTITVNGSSVVTENTLRNAVRTELKNASGAFNESLTYDMLSPGLRNRLITTSGGQKINGTLDIGGTAKVGNLQIKGEGDWQVGSSDHPSDIIMAGPNATISAGKGDLSLNPATDGIIRANAFVQHASQQQCGRIDIEADKAESQPISCPGITDGAIILLTPCQKTDENYWLEIDAKKGTFKVCRGENGSPLSFNYFVGRK